MPFSRFIRNDGEQPFEELSKTCFSPGSYRELTFRCSPFAGRMLLNNIVHAAVHATLRDLTEVLVYFGNLFGGGGARRY